MIIDYRTIQSETTLQADICIIGAGAAGITLAREFAATGLSVILLEAGGEDFDEAAQDPYRGEIVGLDYVDLDAARLRFLGGSTNHWGGWCIPMNAIDFERRSWVPYSGWPLTRERLEPLYERAAEICRLGPNLFDERVWVEAGLSPPPIDPRRIRVGFWQFSLEDGPGSSPLRFGPAYRDGLASLGSVQLFLNCNVTNIQTSDDADQVVYVDVSTLEGQAGRVEAQYFILACGGIENARLLLSSNTVEPDGIGNRYGLVGRFFQEHPHVSVADVAINPRYGNDLRPVLWDGREFRPALSMSSDVQEEKGVLNGSLSFHTVPNPESGLQAFRSIRDDVMDGRVPSDLGQNLMRVLSDIDVIARRAYRRVTEPDAMPPESLVGELYARAEQAPNPDSRVYLTRERDDLGMRRVALDWRLSRLDRESLVGLVEAVGAEFGRLDYGRVRLADWLQESEAAWPDALQGGGHHMGTTRMSQSPAEGVVDRQCRVHGVGNLYVAGSSVFPTSGFANPTLTLVALSLRIADHIKARFDV